VFTQIGHPSIFDIAHIVLRVHVAYSLSFARTDTIRNTIYQAPALFSQGGNQHMDFKKSYQSGKVMKGDYECVCKYKEYN